MNVMLVDDHSLFLEGLHYMLDIQNQCCGHGKRQP